MLSNVGNSYGFCVQYGDAVLWRLYVGFRNVGI